MEVNNSNTNSEENSRVTVSSTVVNTPTSSNNCSPKVPQIQVSLPTREFVSTSASVPRKIVGKNLNGTIVVTSAPGNDAELQLYRVMQRASLLAYYDTLLEMGGDDVQQLCDAGEEEFLEIMALVGMASKPLHVRRLQKSLQEWVMNPSLFQVPLSTSLDPSGPPLTPSPQLGGMPYQDISEGRGMFSPSPRSMDATCILSVATSPSPCNSRSSRSYSPMDNAISRPPSASSSPGPSISTTGTTAVQVTPSLTESQISRISAAAEKITKNLPQLEPKPQNTKKKMCKELETVMAMPENDPRRMDQIRKYAAIYGRFDCKRRPEKPLTLHELSVNEAAAQMCRFMPALLTRRDELFPLARQVVRDAGYNYSKGLTQPSSASLDRVYPNDKDSNSDSNSEISKDVEIRSPNKRPKLESSPSEVDENCQIMLKKVKEEIDSDS